MKKFLKKVLFVSLAFMMTVTNNIPDLFAANNTPGILLNGIVDNSSETYINPKSTIMTSVNESKVTYRLVPNYATGAASGVRVHLYLPSLIHIDGNNYEQTPKDGTPTPLGVQGRVSTGGEWTVVGESTVKGTKLTMEYNGDLSGGSSPAFDIFFSGYNDGTSGPYGGIPEGTAVFVDGYVEYDTFDRQPDTKWETPGQVDPEARISLISSDLIWETTLEADGFESMPIWDRYQYAAYNYTIRNTSTNLASEIEGYEMTFDIESIETTRNGILPIDLNRWKYVEGGEPEVNDDLQSVRGQFVGVRGQGGVLIYDITDWNGIDELTEALPYSYSGTGLIMVDQTKDSKYVLRPDARKERQYRVEIPLARQGFPDLPAKFEVKAITNIKFAKGQNWSETISHTRDVTSPTYDVTLEHAPSVAQTPYREEANFEVHNILNASNAPIFDTELRYQADPDFNSKKIILTLPVDPKYVNYNPIFVTIGILPNQNTPSDIEITPTIEEVDGENIYTFDLNHLQNATALDHMFRLKLKERIEPNEALPFNIKVYGTPDKIKVIENNAQIVYNSYMANNENHSGDTEYEKIEAIDDNLAQMGVVAIEPLSKVTVIGNNTTPQSPHEIVFGQRFDMEVHYGISTGIATNSTLEVILNTSGNVGLKDVEVQLEEVLLTQADNIQISALYLNGVTRKFSGTSFNIGDNVHKLIVTSDDFHAVGLDKLITLRPVVDKGRMNTHQITSTFQIFQKDTTRLLKTATSNGYIRIRFLNQAVEAVAKYGTQVTKKNTKIPYRETFTMDYNVNTDSVELPKSLYEVNLLEPSAGGYIHTNKLTFNAAIVKEHTIIVTTTDTSGIRTEHTIDKDNLTIITASDIKHAEMVLLDLYTDRMTKVFTAEHVANIVFGSTQIAQVQLHADVFPPFQVDFDLLHENDITVPNTLAQGVEAVAKYNTTTTKRNTKIPYNDTFSMEYNVNTDKIELPESLYAVNLLKPSAGGFIQTNKLVFNEEIVKEQTIIVTTTDIDGVKKEYAIDKENLTILTNSNIKYIEMTLHNLYTDSMVNVFTAEHVAGIMFGSTQIAKVTLHADTFPPFTTDFDLSHENDVTVPDTLKQSVESIAHYDTYSTKKNTKVSYEAIFEMEYKIDTDNITFPDSVYEVSMLAPSAGGFMYTNKLIFNDEIAKDYPIKVETVAIDGTKQYYSIDEDNLIIQTDNIIKQMRVLTNNLRTKEMERLFTAEYVSNFDLGSTQVSQVTFTADAFSPFSEDFELKYENDITIPNTQTTASVHAVHQSYQGQGVGNRYDERLSKSRSYGSGTWPPSYLDDTLDIGYKSLGGFTGSITRPKESYLNNNQQTAIEIELPTMQFDMYYLKIREELKPYIENVEIYRLNDTDEVLWQTIEGTEWVENSSEGSKYWRINTANAGNSGAELFYTQTGPSKESHAYYKTPWDTNVIPSNPVSRVRVNLKFERINNGIPQLAGNYTDVVEVMGRFNQSSKQKELTNLTAMDKIGTKNSIIRTHKSNIQSLVQYPYAISRTGVISGTNNSSANVLIGETGDYVASIANNEWLYRTSSGMPTHGPNIYVGVKTEWDEWLYGSSVTTQAKSSFHDKLIYEFVYPPSKIADPNFNFEAKHFLIEETEQLPFVHAVIITDNHGKDIRHEFSTPLHKTTKFTYTNGVSTVIQETGDGYEIVLKDGTYPVSFQIEYQKLNGIKNNTAEINGEKENPLTSYTQHSNGTGIDVRVSGVVNGTQKLTGTSNLYRLQDGDNKAIKINSTTAILQGLEPTLSGTLSLTNDEKIVKDYHPDGKTPTQSKHFVNLTNSGQADINKADISVSLDVNYRTRFIEIPSELYNSIDWTTKEVNVKVDNKITNIADYFIEDEYAKVFRVDVNKLFAQNILTTKKVISRNDNLLVKNIQEITVKFEGKGINGVIYGSMAVETTEEILPVKLHETAAITLTGDWVDESVEGGHDWNSQPTFVKQNTKGAVSVGTSSTVSAVVATPIKAWKSAGTGNRGDKPSYTMNGGNAFLLSNRLAELAFSGKHLSENNHPTTDNNVFYDNESNAQIALNNIVAGDTTKVLYKLQNTAKDTLPVLHPMFFVETAVGMKINKIYTTTDELLAIPGLMEGTPELATANNVVTTTVDEQLVDKKYQIKLDVLLNYQEYIYVYIEYEAVNDYTPEGIFATQGKTTSWVAHARPGLTHNYQSYTVKSDASMNIGAKTINLSHEKEPFLYAELRNSNYTFTNPKKLNIETFFDEENVSGEAMRINVKDIDNEILHSNTQLELFIRFDITGNGGFEMEEFPEPTYPEGYAGTYAKPMVYFKWKDAYVYSADFDEQIHDLAEMNELKVDYGIVDAKHGGAVWGAPDFSILGKGHWRPTGNNNATKNYTITTDIENIFTHNKTVAYKYKKETSSIVWKAIPEIEFNAQSFDTKEEALAPYNGAATGKTSYTANDDIWYKITAKNHSTNEGTNTKKSHGKAPLLKPVVFDKIPEYLLTDELDKYIKEGIFDIARALEDNVITINRFDENNQPIVSDIPKVTVSKTQGLDVAGAQKFTNNVHNDGGGLLSTSQPENRMNPAEIINFTTFTYQFSDKIDRGHSLEIMYKTKARETELPYAQYTDGRAVYAPLNGWYTASSPSNTSLEKISMDMASLLHDFGISGDKGHEMTKNEFLSNSSSWLPGANTARGKTDKYTAANLAGIYYDSSANKDATHRAFMRELAGNELYTTINSTVLDNIWKAGGMHLRVNDGLVENTERILWAQDGLQLNRAWLYGASEMIPNIERKSHGVDEANFYQETGSLNSSSIQAGYSPYSYDDYTYAVQLHEQFTMRMHAVNMGDRAIEQGVKFIQTLPIGITPYDEDGNLIGITAYDGNKQEIPSTFRIIQTPAQDEEFRAPKQSQEAGSYQESYATEIPYVIEVLVERPLSPRFNGSSDVKEKYTSVDLRARVAFEPTNEVGGQYYWYDELTVEPIADEEYYEVYDDSYGAFHYGAGAYTPHRFNNDSIKLGTELLETHYNVYNDIYYFAFEPYGMYIRGLNAQGKTTNKTERRGIITGDRIAMRKPTLRVWNKPENLEETTYDQTVESFVLQPYEEFRLHAIVENQQIETTDAYNRTQSGYNINGNSYLNDDIWKRAPQTIGGARGTYFEPKITTVLPNGLSPILQDGTYLRYGTVLNNAVDFEATINNVDYESSTFVRDVAEEFSVEVREIAGPKGPQFTLTYTLKQAQKVDIAYNQALVLSPKLRVISVPLDGETSEFDNIITLADSDRPLFVPIVSEEYTTGSTPTELFCDTSTVVALNGQRICQNDRRRRDSTSSWSNNMGALKITNRLISKTTMYTKTDVFPLSKTTNIDLQLIAPDNTEANGAYGTTTLRIKKPIITNETYSVRHPGDIAKPVGEALDVDAAGKYWYGVKVENITEKSNNQWEEVQTHGDVHNSQFLLTMLQTNFAETTGEMRFEVININGEKQYLDKAEFESLGYKAEQVGDLVVHDEDRNRVQFLITTPDDDILGVHGTLKTGVNFVFLYEARLVSGYDDAMDGEEEYWTGPELIANSYVSVITDNTKLAGVIHPDDFIVQNPNQFVYRPYTDDNFEGFDVNGDGVFTKYAMGQTEITILKPKGEVRKNTTRPRLLYSSGQGGDPYFNTSDTIEYMVTHAMNTGSGLKEIVIEDMLPAYETNKTAMDVSLGKISSITTSITTGKWEIPGEILAAFKAEGKSEEAIGEIFRTFIYVSKDLAEDGFEKNDTWTLLNPAGSSIFENKEVMIPENMNTNLWKVRIVIKSMDHENYLLPKGLRLDVDADPTQEGKQNVTETDPTNLSTETYPDEVRDNAIRIKMNIHSDSQKTLHIFNHLEMWGNYVADTHAQLDESKTRSYLTPSRPVVNVKYKTEYYRNNPLQPVNARFSWSDITTVLPKVSPHLKFTGDFINAEKSMWERNEDHVYSEDMLIDPVVTFELPPIIKTGTFTHVPYDTINAGHPLHQDHQSRYSLITTDSNQWTYKLVKKDGSISKIDMKDFYAGPWNGTNQNVFTIWFNGIVMPGDHVIVEFIGEIDGYTTGQSGSELKSKAMVSNNTGLLQPLNSRLNHENKLGYVVDEFDYTDDTFTSDRLVFMENLMFEFETYDNFGKNKKAITDLNQAGTASPQVSRVSEGANITYKLTVDNTKEVGATPYPYPIIYDVLPHLGDTSMMSADVKRNSQYSGWLEPNSIHLESVGADKHAFSDKEYTVYVGPFKMDKGTIVKVPLLPVEDTKTQAFFNAIGKPSRPSALRQDNFVKLSDIKDPEILKEVQSILVLVNDENYKLGGESQLTFTYDVKVPQNTKALLEHETPISESHLYTAWNSFVSTQITESFIPQESNNAGAFPVELQNKTYIGNYVWWDQNMNGVQDEGTIIVDENGRELMQPSKDLDYDGVVDDAGINDVTVYLLSPNGYQVNKIGESIIEDNGMWYVVDDATGELQLDEVFLEPKAGGTPLVTTTEVDVHGNAGYYIFANIAPGTYRVAYEFPNTYNRYRVTTPELFGQTPVQIFDAGEAHPFPATVLAKDRLTAVSEPVVVDEMTTDMARMSFDLGVAQKVRLGGTVFKEDLKTLDGRYNTKTEVPVNGYNIYLKQLNGDAVLDRARQPLTTKSDAQGKFVFDFLPKEEQYYIEVTDEQNKFNEDVLISPIVLNINPLAEDKVNDAFTPKNQKIIKTNTINLPFTYLEQTQFADELTVGIGVYDRTNVGIIGNRVWLDDNRDGIQDANEPGVAGQELHLEQYIKNTAGELEKTKFAMKTKSNADGYYYFTAVPMHVKQGDVNVLAHYQVVVRTLVEGLTITEPLVGTDIEVDNNFNKSGIAPDYITLEDETGLAHAVSDNTIDLGLMTHELATISGLSFIDAAGTGLNIGELTTENTTFGLEVKVGESWKAVQIGTDGKMIEPRKAKQADDAYIITSDTYVFEYLHQINNATLQPYEYRVVAREVALWNNITLKQQGDDVTIDNDFEETAVGIDRTATTDTLTVALVDTDNLIGYDTFAVQSQEAIDLGLIPLVKLANIGDYLWYDTNKDGLQDADELPVQGVEMALYELDAKGALIPVQDVDGNQLFTTTDVQGNYNFEVEPAVTDKNAPEYQKLRKYVVGFTRLSRQELTAYNISSNGNDSQFMNLTNKGNNVYPSQIIDKEHTVVSRVGSIADTDVSGYVNYETTRDDKMLDGGIIYHETIRSIGDTVYEDINVDGIQNVGEPGILDLSVTLYRFNHTTGQWEEYTDENGNSVLVTDANGYYEFAVEAADMEVTSTQYLVPHMYRVKIQAPTNYRLVEINNEFKYQTTTDVDGIPIQAVYNDVLSDIIILAQADAGRVDLDTLVDHFTADAGFGVYDTEVIIGGIAWEDANFDGLQDVEETKIVGQEMTLWKLIDGVWQVSADSNLNTSVLTDEDGVYNFTVAPTDYDVTSPNFLQPFAYKVTAIRGGYQELAQAFVGEDKTIDSDFMQTEPHTFNELQHQSVSTTFSIYDLEMELVNLKTVRNDMEMDLGLSTARSTVQVGGYAWEDTNLDGVVGSDEQPLIEQAVTLWKWNELAQVWDIADTTTTGSGRYEFTVAPTNYAETAADYLVPYAYRATATRQGNESWTQYQQGVDPTIDSNIQDTVLPGMPASQHLGVLDTFEISAVTQNGQMDIHSIRDDLDKGFGRKAYATTVQVGGYAWEDTNLDGIAGEDELPIDEQEVILWQWNETTQTWNAIATTPTVDGRYEFTVVPTNYDETAADYLVPYAYRATATRQGNESWTQYQQGVDPTIDSNIQDAVLPGMPASQHLGVLDTFEISAITQNGQMDIHSIRDDLDKGFGRKAYATTVQVGGYAWEDTNLDGIAEENELPIDEQEVILWQWDEATQVWDAIGTTPTVDGRYEFTVAPTNFDEAAADYLVPYQYVVTTTRQGNETWTQYQQGLDIAIDSNIQDAVLPGMPESQHLGLLDVFEISTNQAGRINLYSIQNDLHKGFGRKISATTVQVGGFFWSDTNPNGFVDEDEVAMDGQEITLWQLDEVTGLWRVVDTRSTLGGRYEFTVAPTNYDEMAADYLVPYQYRATTMREGNEIWTAYRQEGDYTIDSNVEGEPQPGMPESKHLGLLDVFEISTALDGRMDVHSIQDDMHKGVGIIRYNDTALIGDTVWDDLNKNGVLDNNEQGLPDVQIILQKNTEDNWENIAETTTDENGVYNFEVAPTNYDEAADDYLIPYIYRVQMQIPEGYMLASIDNAVTDNELSQKFAFSHNAELIELEESIETAEFVENEKILAAPSTVKGDVTLDFGVHKIPNAVVPTGLSSQWNNRIFIPIIGSIMLIWFILFKKKEEEKE